MNQITIFTNCVLQHEDASIKMFRHVHKKLEGVFDEAKPKLSPIDVTFIEELIHTEDGKKVSKACTFLLPTIWF